jgi:hypothetical protein
MADEATRDPSIRSRPYRADRAALGPACSGIAERSPPAGLQRHRGAVGDWHASGMTPGRHSHGADRPADGIVRG